MGLVPAGSFANRNFCAKSLHVAPDVDPVLVDLLSDAQTNGGLLLAVAPDQVQAVSGLFTGQGISARRYRRGDWAGPWKNQTGTLMQPRHQAPPEATAIINDMSLRAGFG